MGLLAGVNCIEVVVVDSAHRGAGELASTRVELAGEDMSSCSPPLQLLSPATNHHSKVKLAGIPKLQRQHLVANKIRVPISDF